MAIEAEDIKVLNVDGTPHVVADLPDNIKRLVDIYNTWRQDEINAKMEVMKVEGAMRNISNEIILAVRAHMAPAEEAAPEAAAPPSVPPVAAAPAPAEMPASELDGVDAEDATDV